MIRLSALAAAILLSSLAKASPATYRIDGFGIQGRSVSSLVLNDAGDIAFSVFPEEPLGLPALLGESFLIREQNKTSLGSLGGVSIVATHINNTQQIVGYSLSENGDITSVLYSQSELSSLDFDGPRGSFPTSINNIGEIVGQQTFEIGARAFHRTESGIVTDLVTLGGDRSIAHDINDLGEIVGSSRNLSGRFEAFFTNGSGLHALGTLGGPTSSAQAINDNATVVGSSLTDDFAQHATLFDLGGSPVDLAPNWAQSGASDINNSNEIVGFVTATPNQNFLAALFNATGDEPQLLQELEQILFSSSRVSAVGEGIFEVIKGDFQQGLVDSIDDFVPTAWPQAANPLLEFGEGFLDRVEVW